MSVEDYGKQASRFLNKPITQDSVRQAIADCGDLTQDKQTTPADLVDPINYTGSQSPATPQSKVVKDDDEEMEDDPMEDKDFS